MSFRVLGTNHTSFTVSNLDRSIGFLRDCLGFDVISKAPTYRLEDLTKNDGEFGRIRETTYDYFNVKRDW